MIKQNENTMICCEVIQDLLPLYHDKVVSEKTKKVIENHLRQCSSCKKEYQTLCADLPIDTAEESTQKQFLNMVHHHKRKQIIITIFSSILACLLLVALYFGQMQIPISSIPDNEITVQRIYRYETDEGYKFFVLYTAPSYNYTTGETSVKHDENGDTLVMKIKKPLISRKYVEVGMQEDIWVFECGYESGDNGTLIFQDFSAVEFGGNIVWEKEKNSNDEIPDYVYAYEDFNNPDSEVQRWSMSSKDGYLEAKYNDGSIVRWDLDGNVLYDSRSNVLTDNK